MENKKVSQKTSNHDSDMNKALSTKWSKLTAPEVQGIVDNHDKLSEVLRRRYSMTTDDAQKESATFFKPYGAKKTTAVKH